MAQIDTASGVINDIKAIGEAICAAGHSALLMVDTVASLGCVPFEMDAWGVDVAMAGSQKGLMTPPGLSFTAAGARAREAHKKASMRTPYWDWTFRDGEVHYHKYCGTPPEHLLFGLRTALDLIFAEGLENVDEIAAVDGVDALWIGQYDLTTSLGIPGQFTHPTFTDAVKRVVDACHRHGKAATLAGLDVAELAAGPANGFRMLVYLADLWIYQQALRRCFGTIRDALPKG